MRLQRSRAANYLATVHTTLVSRAPPSHIFVHDVAHDKIYWIVCLAVYADASVTSHLLQNANTLWLSRYDIGCLLMVLERDRHNVGLIPFMKLVRYINHDNLIRPPCLVLSNNWRPALLTTSARALLCVNKWSACRRPLNVGVPLRLNMEDLVVTVFSE